MIYGYARVSTKKQEKDGNSLEAQEIALRNAGATVIYSDAFTGTTRERPEFTKLEKVIAEGDTLIITKLDRIARSTIEGNQIIQELMDKGVNVHVLNMGLLDSSPSGTLIRSVMLAFAQFERDMIVERTSEGKAIARAAGRLIEGRPKKYSRIQIAHALELLNTHSYKQVEALTGISKSTLIRARKSRYFLNTF